MEVSQPRFTDREIERKLPQFPVLRLDREPLHHDARKVRLANRRGEIERVEW